MFGSVSEHFYNLRRVKDAKLVFPARMQYFGYQNLWSIHSSPSDPKMMFPSVSEHFTNPRQVKDEKLVFRARMQYIEVPKLWSIHSSPLDPNDVCECFGWFHQPSTRKKMQNLCCTISGYQSCEAFVLVDWTQNDVWKCFGAFRKPSAGKRRKTRVLGPNAIFRGTKVVKHPF
jgi:acid stress-induced BolA-like protein IbaG/YrbA